MSGHREESVDREEPVRGDEEVDRQARPDHPRQEEDRLSGRSGAIWMAGSVLSIVIVALVAWGLLELFEGGPPSSAESAEAPGRAPSPFAEPIGALDTNAPLRRPFGTSSVASRPDSATRERMESYAWIDRDRGLARIPIQKAMEIVVARRAGEGPTGTPDDDGRRP